MQRIPEQLKREDFKFVLLGKWDKWKNKSSNEENEMAALSKEKIESLKEQGWVALGKAPFESGWQNKHITYSDEKLVKHLENPDNNYGVIGGGGNLRIIDIDNIALGEEISKRLDTFTVTTGSGGKHIYIICEYDTNHVLVNEIGEYRAKNYLVVGPNCKHITGNTYKITKDMPVKEISKEKLLEIISPFLRQENNDSAEMNITQNTDTSRSGREWHELLKLLQRGYSKQEVFTRMNVFSKWLSASTAYREHSYKKAYNYVSQQRQETDRFLREEISKPLEIYCDTQVDTVEAQEITWLVQDLIPENSLTIIGGKASSFKSTATLHFAYAISEGKKVFNRLETKKAKVLYLNEENSWSIFKPIAIGIRKGLEMNPSENLYFSTFQDLRLDFNGGREKLENVIKEKNINVIVLDSLKRFISFEENAADKVNEFYLNTLKPIMVKYNVAIIMLHHTKKDPVGSNTYHKLDALRGSSDFVNIADSIVYFKRTIGSDFFSMEQVKNRAAQEMKMRKIKVVREEDSSNILKIEFVDMTEAEHEGDNIESNEAARIILEKIKENKITLFKVSDAEKWCEGVYKRTKVKEGINILVEDSYLEKKNNGKIISVLVSHPELAVLYSNNISSNIVPADSSKSDINQETLS